VDGVEFDRLVQRAVSVPTRRRFIRLLGSSTVGLLTTALSAKYGRAQSELGLVLGAACTTDAECIQVQGSRFVASVICADNGIVEDGPLNCCLNEGGLCLTDLDCCGSLLCIGYSGAGVPNGHCSSPNPIDEGLPPGSVCTFSEECSQFGGVTYCSQAAQDAGSSISRCCGDEGRMCAHDAACCGSLICVSGICRA
jgi:hypothetical protein